MSDTNFWVREQQSVALHLIEKRKDQPRRYFDPEAMEELVLSVKEKGILQPILLRPLKDDPQRYELVAGERRLEAARRAHLPGIPAVIRELSDEEVQEIALIENVQREDLNPVEEVDAVLKLLSRRLKLDPEQVPSHLTAMRYTNLAGKDHEDIAVIEDTLRQLGKPNWHTFVTTKLPLLNLPPEILEQVRLGKLDYTKARVVGSVKRDYDRRVLLEMALDSEISLRELKARVNFANQPPVGELNRDIFAYMNKLRTDYKKQPARLSERDTQEVERLMEKIRDILISA